MKILFIRDSIKFNFPDCPRMVKHDSKLGVNIVSIKLDTIELLETRFSNQTIWKKIQFRYLF